MRSLAIQSEDRLKQLHFTKDRISLDWMDGPTITLPLVSYPRSPNATPAQPQKWQVRLINDFSNIMSGRLP
ncbi:hypothetical protein Q5692_20690 [Microcoleus sp. C2C3]|uniref:DUF2442 domain-containing protein n=1 Tax=unclassified Microcoleus TaxID=2642155 RepID=UPI002FD42D89